MTDARDEGREVDPIEFLRAALKISPEDAAQVREDAAHRSAEDEHRDRPASRPDPS